MSYQDVGIRFLGVKLLHLNFEVRGDVPEKIPSGLSFGVHNELSEDGQRLTVLMTTDVFGALPDGERPEIDLAFTLAGFFDKSEEGKLSLRVFAESMAPAHLIPFVREMIVNITSRSPLPTLHISPINVNSLVDAGIGSLTTHQEGEQEQQV